MAQFTIYHNPRCTKSRTTLELLREHGVEPQIVEYLQDPPSVAQLRDLIAKLGIEPQALVRKGEAIYKERYAGKSLTAAQWLAALAKDPILIERPVVVSGRRAVIGRPPENVLALLK